ncbi:MAG TPA: molybdenum cofactor guanylyltransferase [Acidimicrobiales bacterium]|nr:molybdenum cofactor guanylyltransferase [Acidimicrobiales bacterium]MDP7117466.1 molybdenum cofactor guanylyltransferase [Acidimicrobiales bacterium]MDP7410519.1 molybdenum cofactor guanylyltransferase [Acidimicrobiales bacterium]MEE1522421.1 molybdenum cofactor guanylyltransferase [Acidimicrobiales bacterium]MEE1570390.1 molybdenum cofactor guanylyltransferase [Acidimicrobiales bacterium]
MTRKHSGDPEFVGAVLIGGSSRRMGTDKALLASAETGGLSLLRLAAGALNGAGAREVVAVGRSDTSLSGEGLRVIPDLWEGEGPLGGIVTAMSELDSDEINHIVVLACDLLAPSSASIRALLARAAKKPDHVVVPLVDGQHEWLHACWPLSLKPLLEAAFEDGLRAPRSLPDDIPVEEVTGIDPATTRDADTPGDLPWRLSTPTDGPIG